MQTQAAIKPGEKPPFTGTFDCFRKTVRHEVCACSSDRYVYSVHIVIVNV